MIKYIFVTGGVVSSLGKGITAASLGRLLKNRGLKVTIQKFDPYINIDPGTMSPYQHGEVFVTEDGAETDLDLGHYERFIDINLRKNSNVTAGKIYWSVINKERKGNYLGSTVQVIPHITNEIKDLIYKLGKEDNADVVITEIGGTVGDIESLPFLEAIRQVKKEVGKNNALYIHVTLVPYISVASELKTKPTQHSVKELRSIGIHPDIIVCRVADGQELSLELKDKIALFCDIDINAVIENKNAEIIYQVPLKMFEQGLDKIVIEKLDIKCGECNLVEWRKMVNNIISLNSTVKIAIVGKYVALPDAYLSVSEALRHAGLINNTLIDIKWIDAEDLDKNIFKFELYFSDVNGILVPGGFGDRGIEGKINAIRVARENKIPFFGICLGMQTAVIEFARNICGMNEAHSTEINKNTPFPVIDLMSEQISVMEKGGTMRLGVYPCKILDNSLTYKAYKKELIYERHRHRYEFNNVYRERFKEFGLKISGISPDGRLIEIIEIADHPWFVGVQFHPEFKSRPTNPHPLFVDFVNAAIIHQNCIL